jgi:hypothetical protein
MKTETLSTSEVQKEVPKINLGLEEKYEEEKKNQIRREANAKAAPVVTVAVGAIASALVTDEEKKRKENEAKENWVNTQTIEVTDNKIKARIREFLHEALEKNLVTIATPEPKVATEITNLIKTKYDNETKSLVEHIIQQLDAKGKTDWFFSGYNYYMKPEDSPELVKNKLLTAKRDFETGSGSDKLSDLVAKNNDLEYQIADGARILNKGVDELKQTVLKAEEEKRKKEAKFAEYTKELGRNLEAARIADAQAEEWKRRREEENEAKAVRVRNEAAETLRLQEEEVKKLKRKQLKTNAANTLAAAGKDMVSRRRAERLKQEQIETAANTLAAARKGMLDRRAAEKTKKIDIQFKEEMRNVEASRRAYYKAIRTKLTEFSNKKSTILEIAKQGFKSNNNIKIILTELAAIDSKLIRVVDYSNLSDDNRTNITSWKNKIAEALELLKKNRIMFTDIQDDLSSNSFINDIVEKYQTKARMSVESEELAAKEAAEEAKAEAAEKAAAEKAAAEAAAAAEKAAAEAAAAAEKAAAEAAAEEEANAKKLEEFNAHSITQAIRSVTEMMKRFITWDYKPVMENIIKKLKELDFDNHDAVKRTALEIEAEYTSLAMSIISRAENEKIKIKATKTTMEEDKPINRTQIAIIDSIINIITAIQQSTNTLKEDFPKAIFENPGAIGRGIIRLIETSTESVKEETKAIETTITKLEGVEELNKYWKTLAEENWHETKRISFIMLKHMENIANKKKDKIDFIYAKIRTEPERLVINLVTLRDVLNEDSTTWKSTVSAPVLKDSRWLEPARLPAPINPRPATGGGVKTRKKRRRRRKRRKILTKNNKNKNKNKN